MERRHDWLRTALLAVPAVWLASIVALANGGGTAAAQASGAIPDAEWQKMVSTGEARFNKICGVCHPGGGEDIGPEIRGKGFAIEHIKQQVRNGSPPGKTHDGNKMKAISLTRLPDTDLDAVLAYLEKIGAARDARAYLSKNRSR